MPKDLCSCPAAIRSMIPNGRLLENVTPSRSRPWPSGKSGLSSAPSTIAGRSPPPVFDVWMRLLTGRAGQRVVAAGLVRVTRRQGIHPRKPCPGVDLGRLIFARPPEPYPSIWPATRGPTCSSIRCRSMPTPRQAMPCGWVCLLVTCSGHSFVRAAAGWRPAFWRRVTGLEELATQRPCPTMKPWPWLWRTSRRGWPQSGKSWRETKRPCRCSIRRPSAGQIEAAYSQMHCHRRQAAGSQEALRVELSLAGKTAVRLPFFCFTRSRAIYYRRSCLPGRRSFCGGPVRPGSRGNRRHNRRWPFRHGAGKTNRPRHSQGIESLAVDPGYRAVLQRRPHQVIRRHPSRRTGRSHASSSLRSIAAR